MDECIPGFPWVSMNYYDFRRCLWLPYAVVVRCFSTIFVVIDGFPYVSRGCQRFPLVIIGFRVFVGLAYYVSL